MSSRGARFSYRAHYRRFLNIPTFLGTVPVVYEKWYRLWQCALNGYCSECREVDVMVCA